MHGGLGITQDYRQHGSVWALDRVHTAS